MDGLRVVRMVGFQFSFSNPTVVPSVLKRLSQETKEESVDRRSRATGVMIIEPTEQCSLLSFLGELEAEGYEMVDAFYQERVDDEYPQGKRTYHMVRFLFTRHEFAEVSDEFRKARDVIRTELQRICEEAMWRVRAFSNPFYGNGEEVDGQRAVSVNLEARVPLFLPNGQPVTMWQKDERGRRIGVAPLPVGPKHTLHFAYGATIYLE